MFSLTNDDGIHAEGPPFWSELHASSPTMWVVAPEWTRAGLPTH